MKCTVSLIAAGLLLADPGESVSQNVSYPTSTQGGFYTHNAKPGRPRSPRTKESSTIDATQLSVTLVGTGSERARLS